MDAKGDKFCETGCGRIAETRDGKLCLPCLRKEISHATPIAEVQIHEEWDRPQLPRPFKWPRNGK